MDVASNKSKDDTRTAVKQTRSHVRDTITSRKRQVIMRKGKSTIQADNCCSVAVHSFAPRSQISNFCKNQPLEELRALLCTSFTSCPEAFHDGLGCRFIFQLYLAYFLSTKPFAAAILAAK